MGGSVVFCLQVLFLLSFANKIASSPVQPFSDYLFSPLGSNSPAPSIPGSPYPNYGPNYQFPPAYPSQAKQIPPSSLPKPLTAIANLAATIPVQENSVKTPSVPKSSEVSPSPLDPNVLNNLAIALQLLIVSNILNTPPENLSKLKLDMPKLESMQKFETVPISPLTLPVKLSSLPLQTAVPYFEGSPLRNLVSLESLTLPNSKFLGSSGLVDTSVFGSAINPFISSFGSQVSSLRPVSSFGPSVASFNSAMTPFGPLPSSYGSGVTPTRPNTRSSMTLMSPYEALGSGSSFSDLSSMFSSSYSKNDFQSPYASILAADSNRDLFSMTDFL